ncbi:MAG: hypothetical protein GY870_07235 [archaeon]|nr:hypothetical protein [archaeon]
MSDKITADDLEAGKKKLGSVDDADMKRREEEKKKRQEELEKVKAALEAAGK